MKKSNSSPPPAFPDLEISSASTASLYASENTHTHSQAFLTDKTTCSHTNTSSSFPGCSMSTEVRKSVLLPPFLQPNRVQVRVRMLPHASPSILSCLCLSLSISYALSRRSALCLYIHTAANSAVLV